MRNNKASAFPAGACCLRRLLRASARRSHHFFIFFERCVRKLSVSCSYIFLVIVNHFRPYCLPIAYPSQFNAGSISFQIACVFIIHCCPIFGTTDIHHPCLPVVCTPSGEKTEMDTSVLAGLHMPGMKTEISVLSVLHHQPAAFLQYLTRQNDVG